MSDPAVNSSSKFDRFVASAASWVIAKKAEAKVVRIAKVVNLVIFILLGILAFTVSMPWLVSAIGWLIVAILTGLAVFEYFLGEEITRRRDDLSATIIDLEDRNLALAKDLGEANLHLAASREALENFRNAVMGVLLPLAGKLERLPTIRSIAEASAELGRIESNALDLMHRTAGKSADPHAARATLYKLDSDGLPRSVDSKGRAETPRERFEGESLEKILELITRGDARIFRIDDDSNSITPSAGSTYKVVVASAIGRSDPPHGMITIDSSEAEQLSEDDLAVVISAGGMLAAAYRTVELIRELSEAKERIRVVEK